MTDEMTDHGVRRRRAPVRTANVPEAEGSARAEGLLYSDLTEAAGREVSLMSQRHAERSSGHPAGQAFVREGKGGGTSRPGTGARRFLPVTLLFLLLFGGLAGALLWSRPPVTGRAELAAASGEERSWQAVYSLADLGTSAPGELERLVAQSPDVLFFAGPAGLARSGAAPRTFFPVGDGAGAAGQQPEVRFPHIPEEQLAGYGRTAYSVDYGQARFWFLNAAKLAEEPQVQLGWLQRTAAENPQPHRIVLLAEEPAAPQAWQGFTAAGVELVLAGGRLWAPAAAVQAPQPEAWRSAPGPAGWAAWTPPPGEKQETGGYLLLEGRGPRLSVSLPAGGSLGAALGLDAAALGGPAPLERAAVPVGAQWRYRPGGSDLPAVVPEGLDPAGEHPSAGRTPLPAADWRGAGFDAAGWAAGQAPLGRSRDAVRQRGIATALPAGPSPAYYFRHAFQLDVPPKEGQEWTLRAAYEDGIIVYLNGVEVARDSIRDGLVDDRTLGVPHSGVIYESFPLEEYLELLIQGTNTLAVEVHGSHPDTPELWFDLSLTVRERPGAGGGGAP
ncbi:hypothetical protein ACP26L_07050 [Paenibacillus sp. S-38]|uniref:hypothetical protein n=1 Tax=Paenibacillus sp. S-38 TaxID=3416710 RepID=UPI003CEE805D